MKEDNLEPREKGSKKTQGKEEKKISREVRRKVRDGKRRDRE